METLPSNVIADIIRRADVSIDTRLYFREYGFARKPVQVPAGLDTKLAKILGKRSDNFAKYKQVHHDNPFRWSSQIDHVMYKLSDDVYMEMFVTEVEGEVEFTLKMTRFYAGMRLFDMHCDSYDIHTGKPVEFS
jgi:hypothetical protein